MRSCKNCSRELTPGALVCDHCHTLVHSAELERLAAEAKTRESLGEWQKAREAWLRAFSLLPPTSKQADWIRLHAQELAATRHGAAVSQSDIPRQAERFSPAAPAPLSAVQTKPPQSARLQLTSLLSFAAFVAIYSAASGLKFGVGFAVLILIHEMGHFIDIKRRGLPADMPVFLPGLGAYVRWQALGVPLETRAAVSLAGPLAGLFASVLCGVIWWQTGNPLWAGLARSGAILNLLNLIPVWVLDGGQAALALSKGGRVAVLIASLLLWLVVRQNILFLVALGAGYRAFFSGDLPARSSRVTTIYYVAVLSALVVVIGLMPGEGLGLP
jgi:Zn-dependent protease